MGDFASPFRPGSPMISLLGSSSNSGAATMIGMGGDFTALVFNRSGVTDAYLVYGQSSTAVASATLPVVGAGMPAGAGANMLQLPARSLQAFSFGGTTFIGILVGSGNAIIDIVTGEGE